MSVRILPLQAGKRINGAAYDAVNRRLFLTDFDGRVSIGVVDVTTSPPTLLKSHKGPLPSLAYPGANPEEYVATVSPDGTYGVFGGDHPLFVNNDIPTLWKVPLNTDQPRPLQPYLLEAAAENSYPHAYAWIGNYLAVVISDDSEFITVVITDPAKDFAVKHLWQPLHPTDDGGSAWHAQYANGSLYLVGAQFFLPSPWGRIWRLAVSNPLSKPTLSIAAIYRGGEDIWWMRYAQDGNVYAFIDDGATFHVVRLDPNTLVETARSAAIASIDRPNPQGIAPAEDATHIYWLSIDDEVVKVEKSTLLLTNPQVTLEPDFDVGLFDYGDPSWLVAVGTNHISHIDKTTHAPVDRLDYGLSDKDVAVFNGSAWGYRQDNAVGTATRRKYSLADGSLQLTEGPGTTSSGYYFVAADATALFVVGGVDVIRRIRQSDLAHTDLALLAAGSWTGGTNPPLGLITGGFIYVGHSNGSSIVRVTRYSAADLSGRVETANITSAFYLLSRPHVIGTDIFIATGPLLGGQQIHKIDGATMAVTASSAIVGTGNFSSHPDCMTVLNGKLWLLTVSAGSYTIRRFSTALAEELAVALPTGSNAVWIIADATHLFVGSLTSNGYKVLVYDASGVLVETIGFNTGLNLAVRVFGSNPFYLWASGDYSLLEFSNLQIGSSGAKFIDAKAAQRAVSLGRV